MTRRTFRAITLAAAAVFAAALVSCAARDNGVTASGRGVPPQIPQGTASPPQTAAPGVTAHAWTQIEGGLIAHALGPVDGFKEMNCREGLETNYNAGFRLFELDINLTTDGKLAVVHDWFGYDGQKSEAEWRVTPVNYYYHSLMLDDVFAFMAEHEDMYIITDTKSFEYDEEDMLLQFRLMREGAEAAGVIDRVVPQIYNQDMYDKIREAYAWPSLIYTLYASPDTDAEVAAFAAEHDDVQAITMGPSRWSAAFARALANSGKYIYFFTINDEAEAEEYRSWGVRGFYTDYLTP